MSPSVLASVDRVVDDGDNRDDVDEDDTPLDPEVAMERSEIEDKSELRGELEPRRNDRENSYIENGNIIYYSIGIRQQRCT